MTLGRRYGTATVKIRDIAIDSDLPEKFLELILLELKNARIVESVRGAKGGYRLRRAPAEIKLSEIIRLIDGPLAPFGDADQLRGLITTDPDHRALYSVFLEVRDAADVYKRQHELIAQWRNWINANPYPLGINWGSSLEVAFRSLSWIWVDQLLSGTADHEALRSELLPALAFHGRYIERYLSTYFSPNTHLLGEAVALLFLGTLYPQIPRRCV